MKRKSEPPKPKFKGGGCNHVQPLCESPALLLLQKHGNECFQHALAAIDGLSACNGEVEKEPFNLHAFQRPGNGLVQHYYWLSQQDEDCMLLGVRPKMHQFLHLVTIMYTTKLITTTEPIVKANPWPLHGLGVLQKSQVNF